MTDLPKVPADYCALCGHRINSRLWRDHMYYHNIVLAESPKNEDGSWKHQDEYVYERTDKELASIFD